jgi:hypothetical protein
MTRRIRPGRLLRAAAVVVAHVVLAAAPARAQPPIRGVELSIGGSFTGGTSIDADDANLTRPAGERLRLFASEAELRPAVALTPTIGFPLSPSLQLDASVTFGRRDLSVRVSGDFEGADDVRVSETLRQIALDAALLFKWGRRPASARTVPFFLAGGGYFWEYHDGDQLSATGQQVFAGAGLKRALRTSTNPKARLDVLGVRVDARIVGRTGGAAFDDGLHFFPAVGGSLFMRF